jgi:hypothetical protein
MMTPEQRKEYLRKWRNENKDRQKQYRQEPKFKKAEANRHLLRTYGITLERKQEMWDEQRGLCSVCHKPLPDIMQRDCQVEHDHATNKVRSLAHWYCNIIVGVMENHLTLLENVIECLEVMR